MSPALVPPQALHDVWPHVLPGVEAIRERCREVWLPEDVYAALRYGDAQLWAWPGLDSWMVLRVVTDLHSAARTMLVWLAWSRPGTPDRLCEGLDWARQVARQAQIGTVAFESPRKGWERRAPQLGWRAQFTRWVVEA
ncbi:MAG: hypothetical protein MUE59_06155 [Thiobacillaceae bacterium]|jgi:hypothetical protein|nr:hypothetical protein [Thiobacillaceae bacterium]